MTDLLLNGAMGFTGLALVISLLCFWGAWLWNGSRKTKQFTLERQALTAQRDEATFQLQAQQQQALLEQARLQQALAVAEEKQQALLAYQTKSQTETLALQSQLNLLTVQHTQAKTELETLHKSHESWQNQLNTQWQQQLEAFLVAKQGEVKASAQAEYTQQEQQLNEKLTHLLKPLTETLKQYQDKVHLLDKTHHSSAELITAELKRLGQINQKLEGALRFNKGRGNWGELELLRLLEDSGLVEGVGFEKQPAYQNGKKRPDIRVRLPEDRSVFIDAKALQLELDEEPHEQTVQVASVPSHLASEEGFSSEAAFEARCQRHLSALKQAIKTLASKEYQAELEGAADFVILYVPRESMLSLAYMADSNILRWAYDQKVILASPLQLMAMLRLIEHSWKRAKLSEDAQTILKLGTQLYASAARFTERFSKIGEKLNALGVAYADAYKGLEGRQGMMKSLKQLADYGCDAGKRLPETLYLPDNLLGLTVDDVDDFTKPDDKREIPPNEPNESEPLELALTPSYEH